MRQIAVLLLLFTCSGYYMSGQVTVTSGFTPDEYVNDVLLGYGITATNVVYHGDAGQIGEVLNLGDFGMPIQGGLALGSGFVDFLAESTNGDDCGENFPNSAASTMTPQPLATDLLNIANSVPPLIGQSFSVFDVNDIAVIEFDFVATGDSVKFDYVFASMEYPDGFPGQPYNPTGAFVNQGYNDVFAFFLSGPGINGPYANNAINIAVVPESDPVLPITISSVNGALNDEYFVENTDRDPICPDGYTVKLTCESEVECGETYHITIAIGDGNDSGLSSFVILEAGSFESNAVVDIELNINVGEDLVIDPPVMYEDCGEATMVFTRPVETNLAVEESIEIVYTGTAEFGVDYSNMPTTVIFPVGVETVEYSIQAVLDGVDEGVETVQMEILNLAACNGGGLTSYFEFDINDTADPLQVDGFNTALCVGDSVTLVPTITGGYGNFIFDWGCNPGEDTVAYNFVPDAAGIYPCILTVSDTCGMPSDDATFEVDVVEYPPITVDIGDDLLLPCNGFQTVFSQVDGGNPGATGYTYTWTDEDGQMLSSWTETSLDVSTWMGVTSVTLTVEDECGLTGSATINVDVDVPDMIIDLDAAYDVSCNVPFSITPTVNGGQAPYNYSWTEGFSFLGFNSTLNWTTDEDMAVTLNVSDACGQNVELTTDVVVVSPPVNVSFADPYVGPCTEQFVLTPDVSGGSGVYTYEWFQNFNLVGTDATYTYSDGLPASFMLEVTDNCQGTGSATTSVTIDNPPLEIGLADTINASCVDNTVIAVDIVSGAGDYTYAWTVGGVPYGGDDAQITVQSFVTTPVGVEVWDGCGGEDETASLLVIPNVPMTLEVTSDTTVCRGTTVALTATATGGEEGFVYEWPTIPDFPAIGEYQEVTPNSSATYPVEVTDICGETLTESVTVGVQYIYSDFFTSYLSETRIEFIATPDPPCTTCEFQWDFGDGSSSTEVNPIHEYDGIYDYYAQLTVTNPLGCTDSAYTLIEGPVLIYIPSAFTPNNDGINDAFQVVISDLVSYELTIYNRWGDWVFHSTDPEEVWVGNVKGGDHYAPEGLYSYRLLWKGARTDSEELRGTFELMR